MNMRLEWEGCGSVADMANASSSRAASLWIGQVGRRDFEGNLRLEWEGCGSAAAMANASSSRAASLWIRDQLRHPNCSTREVDYQREEPDLKVLGTTQSQFRD